MKNLMPRLQCGAGIAWCLVLSLAAGCGSVDPKVLEEVTSSPAGFLLGPEDVLEVVVWKNQDLSRQVVVRPDGMISLPLIGDVKASGLTADQLANRIAQRLSEFKESPTVSVSVLEVNSYHVYVLGEVNNPGKFQFKSYTTVLQAIAIGGGFTQFASRNSMKVIRTMQNGQKAPRRINIPVRYDDLVAGNGEIGDFVLKAGDTVVVP